MHLHYVNNMTVRAQKIGIISESGCHEMYNFGYNFHAFNYLKLGF